MAKQDDHIRTALRLPPDLHERVHRAALETERTFNAEIVYRLRQTFLREDRRGTGPGLVSDAEVVQELETIVRYLKTVMLPDSGGKKKR